MKIKREWRYNILNLCTRQRQVVSYYFNKPPLRKSPTLIGYEAGLYSCSECFGERGNLLSLSRPEPQFFGHPACSSLL
jgi:hypothetical protein